MFSGQMLGNGDTQISKAYSLLAGSSETGPQCRLVAKNIYWVFFLILTWEQACWFLERGEGREKERERNIDAREKSISCLLDTSWWLIATQVCSLMGNWSCDLSVYWMTSNQLSHMARAIESFYCQVCAKYFLNFYLLILEREGRRERERKRHKTVLLLYC